MIINLQKAETAKEIWKAVSKCKPYDPSKQLLHTKISCCKGDSLYRLQVACESDRTILDKLNPFLGCRKYLRKGKPNCRLPPLSDYNVETLERLARRSSIERSIVHTQNSRREFTTHNTNIPTVRKV